MGKALAARTCLVVGIAGLPACTVLNDISVCERRAPVEHEVNLSVDGFQEVTSEQALAAWPNGRGFVVFSSGEETATRREIRGAFIRSDGSPAPVCGADGEVTITSATGHPTVALAPPANDDEAGLVVYTDELGGLPRVFAHYLRGDGCPVGMPVAVGEETADEQVSDAPTVVGLGDNLFLVAWIATRIIGGSTAANFIRARMLRGDPTIGHLRFDGTALSATGDVVELTPLSAVPRGVTAARLTDDRIGLSWYEPSLSAVTTVFAVFDDDLRELVKRPAGVDDRGSWALPDPPEGSLSFDGSQVLVTWLAQDEGGASTLLGRFFDLEGRPLRAPDAPDGEPFPLDSGADSSQRSPDVTALRDGGFVVVWEGAADGSGSGIRAGAFDRDGARRFVNPACDRTTFGTNLVTDGDQQRPSVVQLADGVVMATWTDHSRQGRDASGSAVRARVYQPRELLPLE